MCCGFGGSTSVRAPEVSAEILSRKLDNVAATNASTLITDNPGCLLHLRGGTAAANCTFDVQHVLEYLANRLPPAVGADG